MTPRPCHVEEGHGDFTSAPAIILPLFRFYTLAETAKLLGISKTRAYNLVRTGTLPAERVGSHQQWCVHAADLLTFVRSR
ncbi:helix-turn-helix domain-containing protein [Georgenia daeguensis]|uniref:helix-turn-helix domain-containing protein n=1 Tax=Georgenia daeguensis TaxID=908355 RepID=UPI003CD09762